MYTFGSINGNTLTEPSIAHTHLHWLKVTILIFFTRWAGDRTGDASRIPSWDNTHGERSSGRNGQSPNSTWNNTYNSSSRIERSPIIFQPPYTQHKYYYGCRGRQRNIISYQCSPLNVWRNRTFKCQWRHRYGISVDRTVSQAPTSIPALMKRSRTWPQPSLTGASRHAAHRYMSTRVGRPATVLLNQSLTRHSKISGQANGFVNILQLVSVRIAVSVELW